MSVMDRLEQMYAYPDRRWIRANFVTSLDGSVTTADGTSGDLGGEADRRAFAVMRSLAEVILVGAGTVRAEGYRQDDSPPIAVVTRSGEVGEFEIVGSLDDVLTEIDRRGYRRILCEGGPTLMGTLVERDLIDELCLTIAPEMVAGPGPRVAHGGLSVSRPMRLAQAEAIDDVLLTRWIRA